MATNAKTELGYNVVTGRNPKTGQTLKRPQLSGVKTMGVSQIVDHAINDGYIPSGTKREAALAVFNGMMAAGADYNLAGYRVEYSSRLTIGPTLTGQLDETLAITSANKLKTRVSPLKDLKMNKDNFTFRLLSDLGMVPRITTFMSVGGKDNKVLIAGSSFTANGTNLAFHASLGDTAALVWKDSGDTEHNIELVPAESDYQHIKFNWTEDLDDIAVGSDVELRLTLSLGFDGGAVHTVSTKAKLVAAS